jgi:hypothetical protein
MYALSKVGENVNKNEEQNNHILTEKSENTLSLRWSDEINDTVNYYTDSFNKKYIGLEHFELKGLEVEEVLFTQQTFECIIKNANAWFNVEEI